jgi:hypothetical protein
VWDLGNALVLLEIIGAETPIRLPLTVEDATGDTVQLVLD